MLTILAVIGVYALFVGISFLVNAGIIWVLTWALVKIGITTILGWTVAFSWPLVIIFTIICAVLKTIFKPVGKKED